MDQFEPSQEQFVEAALCVWEEIDLQTQSRATNKTKTWQAMTQVRRNVGTPTVRYHVFSIAGRVSSAFRCAEKAAGGFYDEAFDWSFVPAFLERALVVNENCTSFDLCDAWEDKGANLGTELRLVSEQRRIENIPIAESNRELSAVLAGLRLYQRSVTTGPLMDQSTFDIASNCDAYKVLTADEVDALCVRLNTAFGPEGATL